MSSVDDRAHLAFALSLLRALEPDPATTFCWSPYSVTSGLGLVASGAHGRTRDELLALLSPGKVASVDRIAERLTSASALKVLGTHQERPVLALSNTLWIRPDIDVSGDFVEGLGDWPGGAVRAADFASDPDGVRRLINQDVAETTRDLIPELLAPGAVEPRTVATLVNALYLRTSWISGFTERETSPQPFHAPGGRRDVPTMRQVGRLPHAAQDGWQAVSLPAHGGVEAVALLPDGDLPDSEVALDAWTLGRLLDSMRSTQVDLFLPRLRVSGRAELQEPLGALGVNTVFTPDADLSGISASRRVLLSSVVHEAVLRVDEQGLEGAAATAAVVSLTAAAPPSRPVVVRLDRPFLLLVRHRRSGEVYFLARVADPGR
ncbi:serpin family protein [Actinoalloteichus spitiensis]|uniref:serpin family protein n=1 Tax=Actinoalloteichus spitiensis TaxID=252394 RepID=UPI0004749EF5|nr:serpin family protein [Actinoalloteichus spitiensis]